MTRAIYSEGEYIPLNWEGSPEWFAVKGRPTPKDAIEVVAMEELISTDKLEFTGYLYARFEPAPRDNDLGAKHYMKLHSNPGKGAFPVAVVNLKERTNEGGSPAESTTDMPCG